MSDPLSFSHAQYEGAPPPPDACAYCQTPLTAGYYRVASRLACVNCAGKAASMSPQDTHAAYARGILFGVLASIAGAIGYALIIIVTHIEIGYAAIGVGYIIGWAMKKGSGGLGGRRYQITAAVLTYLGCAMSFVPMVLYNASQHGKHVSLFGFLYVCALGVVSPFLELSQSMMGLLTLFIIFIGIRFAWRFTAGQRIPIEGPFN